VESRNRHLNSGSGEKTRILIADDHMVVLQGVKAAISEHPEFEVVDTASDGLEALEKVKSLKPDIVIMDISMPNLNGVEAAYRIKEWKRDICIVIFSMYSDKEYVLSLFRAGISAFVLKEEALSDLVRALETVKAGGTYFSRSVQDIVRNHMEELEVGEGKEAKEMRNGISRLSTREKEVFPLLADGKTVKEISRILGISTKTVESHKYNIMEKLNVESVAELTKIALRKNLIEL